MPSVRASGRVAAAGASPIIADPVLPSTVTVGRSTASATTEDAGCRHGLGGKVGHLAGDAKPADDDELIADPGREPLVADDAQGMLRYILQKEFGARRAGFDHEAIDRDRLADEQRRVGVELGDD